MPFIHEVESTRRAIDNFRALFIIFNHANACTSMHLLVEIHSSAQAEWQCSNSGAQTQQQCSHSGARTQQQCFHFGAWTQQQCSHFGALTQQQCSHFGARTQWHDDNQNDFEILSVPRYLFMANKIHKSIKQRLQFFFEYKTIDLSRTAVSDKTV